MSGPQPGLQDENRRGDGSRKLKAVAEALVRGTLERVGRVVGRVQEERPPPADLLESDEAYLVVVDAPGATAEGIEVRYVEDRVVVTVDRVRESNPGFEMRFPGRGRRLTAEVELPEDAVVEPETATAELREDGTLQITLPKRGT
jgi:HSP20 family molecular chaperone IbpA